MMELTNGGMFVIVPCVHYSFQNILWCVLW